MTDGEPTERRTWATTALIALNVGVALSMLGAGASLLLPHASVLVAYGGVDADRVWRGEVWRLFTGTFVHFGLWHLGLNLWVLWQVGRALERMIGGARFLLIYVVSGVFGFALSVLLKPGLAVGASGCIFGATGGLLALAGLVRNGPLGRFLFAALLPFVGATLAIGFLLPFIDNTAHVGGLAMGFLLTLGLCAGDRSFLVEPGQEAPRAPAAERGFGWVALLACMAAFLVVVPLSLRPTSSPAWQARMALRALSRGDLAEARAHARRAEQLAPKDGVVLVAAARVRAAEGDAEGARALLSAALGSTEKQPDQALIRLLADVSSPAAGIDEVDAPTAAALCDAALTALGDASAPELRNDCAWLWLKAVDPAVHDVARAVPLAEQAVRESRFAEPAIVHTLAEARFQSGDAKEAVNLLLRVIAQGQGDAFLRGELARFEQAAREPIPPG